VLDVNSKIITVPFVPLIELEFQNVHVLMVKWKTKMEFVSHVLLLVIIVKLIQNIVYLVILQEY